MSKQQDGPSSQASSQALPKQEINILRPATSANRLQPRWRLQRDGRSLGGARARRWEHWVQEIARRAGVSSDNAQRAAMTLLSPAPAPAAAGQELHLHTHLSPTAAWSLALTLRLGGIEEPPTSATVGGQAPAAPVTEPAFVTLWRQSAALPADRPPAHTPAPAPLPAPALVTRIHQGGRWQHDHALQTTLVQLQTTPVQPAGMQVTQAVPPVPRVVSRPAPPAPPPVLAAPLPQAAGQLRYWSDETLRPPPVDVEQLTDQVIRTIDQRVIAARERLGKAP